MTQDNALWQSFETLNPFSLDPNIGLSSSAGVFMGQKPRAWPKEVVNKILAEIQNMIKAIPDEESANASLRQAQMRQGFMTPAQAESMELAEVRRKIAKGSRDAINVNDVELLLNEVMDQFIGTYESQTGTIPSQGDIDLAQDLISKYFVVEDDQQFSVGDKGKYGDVRLFWSDMSAMSENDFLGMGLVDWHQVVRAVDAVKRPRESQVALQPMYFTKDLEFEAYLNAAQAVGLIDADGRGDDRTVKRVFDQWEIIKPTLSMEGAYTSKALETRMIGVLRQAQGINASNETFQNLNFLTTHFTENPRTQEEQKKILIAQDRFNDLTMDDYNAIQKDPAKWFENKFADQSIIDEYADPEEKAAQEELKRQIRSEALRFQDQFRQWESGATEEGFVRYQPSEIIQLANDAFRTSHETLAPTISQLDAAAKAEREAQEGFEASKTARENRYKLFNTYTKLENAVKSAVMVDNNGKLPSPEVMSYLIGHFASVVDSSIQYGLDIPDVRQWVSENHGSYLPQLINENLVTQFTEDPKMLGDKKVFGGMSIRDRVGLGERPKEQGGGEWGATTTWSNAFISALENNPGWIQSERGRQSAASLADQSLYGMGITPSGEYAPYYGEAIIDGQRYGAPGAEFLDHLFSRMPQQAQNITSWASQNPMASPFSIPAELTATGTGIDWYRSGDRTPVKEVFRDGEWVQEIDYSQMRGYETPRGHMPGSRVTRREITNYDPNTGSYDYVQPSPVIRPGSDKWEERFGPPPLPREQLPVSGANMPYDPVYPEGEGSIFAYKAPEPSTIIDTAEPWRSGVLDAPPEQYGYWPGRSGYTGAK